MKRLLSLIVAILMIPLGLVAQTPASKTPPAAAQHRILIDLTTVISDGSALTLSNVEGLKRHFKDDAEIEVVVHGPAVSLLFRNDVDFGARIQQLHNAGVHFVVGTSTVELTHAKKEDLFPFVEFVPSSIAEIVLRQEQGWSYIKGGY
jgi:uncharacterized protein